MHAIENGIINYLSVSQVIQFEDCPSQWHFVKVQHLPMEGSDASKKGTLHHSHIETYLKTGVDILDKFERAGLPFMPKPGPDLFVESKFKDGELIAEGIDFHGNHNSKADLEDPRLCGEGLFVIKDWKFSGDPRRNAVKAEALALGTGKGIQTIGYAKRGFNLREARGLKFDEIELDHVYFSMKGRPDAFQVSTTVDLDLVNKEWQKVGALVRQMKHVAAEPDVKKVPKAHDIDTCMKYGGCPFFAQCKGTASLISSSLKRTSLPTKKEKAMGFLQSLTQASVTPTPPAAPATPQHPLTATTEVKIDVPKKVLIEDQSTQSDATLLAARAAQVVVLCGPDLKAKGIYRFGDGKDRLFLCATKISTGALKFSFADLDGKGPGALLNEGDKVLYIRDGVPTEPPMVLPPDAPKSDPALASRKDPLATVTPPRKDASQDAEMYAEEARAAVAAEAAPAAETEKPRRTRRSKAEMEAARAEVEQKHGVTTCNPLPVEEKIGPETKKLLLENAKALEDGVKTAFELADRIPSPRTRVWVNCMVPGIAGKSLIPYVEKLSYIVCKGVGVDVPDIRLSYGDAIGFGKWQGALAAVVKSNPLEPGDYLVTETDDRIRAILPEIAKLCAPGDFVVGR